MTGKSGKIFFSLCPHLEHQALYFCDFYALVKQWLAKKRFKTAM